ncbi:aldo/keto reductase [Rhizobium leguminosarum bv. viciae]|uniref:D-threo-aldose 1-dehydrogenase n=2 Tax=Rhizobium TaxID=379 RepID=A0AAX2QEF3_9HYPH|nr:MULTISPECIES: aldo/keto reductase [Rhizobium]MBY3185497.1 aldo/keto reductase [Rhizobium laguerreae]MBY3258630.1 aldo/keto reductase [Rhizobium laguerreae]MBY3286467.1 aldo/keto reductase [Rhizobium laguerreae]MBY3293130.1 aldo/keto reductase [Rhizobium laguerreae]MBY3300007.1 aldo/keto reductase [Rhizobium laguerreae]
MTAVHEQRRLGRTSLSATTLGLGTTAIGGLYTATSEDSAEETMQTAWDLGVRFFDTAPQYGNGMAEQRLGAFLRKKPSDRYVLCTKVGRLLRLPENPQGEDAYYKGTPPERPVFDFSYDGVMRSVEDSLTRLGLERIDVLHIHDPDMHYREALDGAYKALDTLRREKSIAGVGVGMNQSEMLAEFARNGNFDCFLLAGRYTLLEQGALKELLPLCVEKNISIIIGGVYNSGLLADPRAGAKFNYEDADKALVDRAIELETVCLRHGVPLKAAAIQFPLAHPAVTSILTGARSHGEMIENDALFRQPIPSSLWEELRAKGMIAEEAPTT